MRRLLGFALAASLGVFATACGGGGGGSATTPAAAPATVPTGVPFQGVSNFSGPTGKVTVSLKVPPAPKTPASAATRAKAAAFLASHAGKIRTLANTSPTASIRAAAASAIASRKPAFIPPNIWFLEYVLTDSANSTVIDDEEGSCDSESCTNTFNAPIGNGMNVTLYLYDYNDYLVAAGTAGGVNVTLGNNTPVNITLNGVVTFFSILSDNNGPFLDDPSGSTSFNLSVYPEDEYGDTLSTPGVLLDNTFTQIGSVSLTVDTDTTSNTAQPLAANSDLSFGPSAFTYRGAMQEGSINFTATEVPTGGPLVPSFNTSGSVADTQLGALTINTTPTSLQWTNPNNYPILASDPVTNLPNSSGTAEFPLATNAGTYTFGLLDTSTTFGGTITLSALNCGGVTTTYAPALGPQSYASLSSGSYFQITMGSAGATNTCVITATDGQTSATLNIYTNQSSIVIQGKARKH
jgi:hypothetical protein